MSTRPTSSAPKKAPRIEPMPPIDDDHEGEDQDVVAHAGLDREDRRRPWRRRSPASIAPKPNTSVNSRRMSTPSAETIGALRGAGADQHAEPRAVDQQPEQQARRRGRRR